MFVVVMTITRRSVSNETAGTDEFGRVLEMFSSAEM